MRSILVTASFVAALLSFAACDSLIQEPANPHPYGEGNGKVVVVSDLTAAQQIDVTLGGESIGSVTRFIGCSSEVTGDAGFAQAIRPAGDYQISARSTTDLTWQPRAVTIEADSLTTYFLRGRPSRYANHLAEQLEGRPTTVTDNIGGSSNVERDIYHVGITAPQVARLKITRPSAVQGDRIDVILNGSYIIQNALLGTTDTMLNLSLVPGANYIAFRLSQDSDNDGTTGFVSIEYGEGRFTLFGTINSTRWNGKNILYEC